MKLDKRPPQIKDVEVLPDAWERFEKAFDKVMKAKPMPAKKTPRESSQVPSEKRGGSKLA